MELFSQGVAWPNKEDGTPVAPAVLLETVDRQQFFDTCMSLTGYGVPFVTEDNNPAIFSKVLFGSEIVGGIIHVPETLLDDARALLTPQDPADSPDAEEESQ